MGYERRNGDIILFRNDWKKNDREPDLRGEGIDNEGKPIEISLWQKEGKKGIFFAGNIKPKSDKPYSYAKPPRGDGMFDPGTDAGRAVPLNTKHGVEKANAYITDVVEEDIPF